MANEVLELCREMVAIASVNPEGAEDFEPPLGEGRMVEFVCGWLERNGLDVQRQVVRPGRENVIAQAGGIDTSKTLLLCAHTDTVGIEGMVIEPFEPLVKDGRLFGRGSCDTKASLAAMLIAFRERVRQGNLPFNLTLLASCGEEYDMAGARAFAQEYGQTISGAVFGEPTQLKVVNCHKGTVRFRLVCEGKSAHSSTPDLGDNAIVKMAQTIGTTRQFAQRLQTQTQHVVLGPETLAVTIIQGGDQINVIPNRCEAQVDWRYLPGHSVAECQAQLTAELGNQAEVDLLGYYDPMETDAQHAMVAALLDVTDKVCGQRRTEGARYATDASAFGSLSIPTLVLGPGNVAQAHTADEYIEIEQLEKGLAVYQAYLDSDWGI